MHRLRSVFHLGASRIGPISVVLLSFLSACAAESEVVPSPTREALFGESGPATDRGRRDRKRERRPRTDVRVGSDACTSIRDGSIVTSDGDSVALGRDDYGYHYERHNFVGSYCGINRDETCPYEDTFVWMFWNEAWLSNRDCDGDDRLDRHRGHASYRGSGAWEVYLQQGSCLDATGDTRTWRQSMLFVAAPETAYVDGGTYFTEDGHELGAVLWTDFAVAVDVLDYPCDETLSHAYHSDIGLWKARDAVHHLQRWGRHHAHR